MTGTRDSMSQQLGGIDRLLLVVVDVADLHEDTTWVQVLLNRPSPLPHALLRPGYSAEITSPTSGQLPDFYATEDAVGRICL